MVVRKVRSGLWYHMKTDGGTAVSTIKDECESKTTARTRIRMEYRIHGQNVSSNHIDAPRFTTKQCHNPPLRKPPPPHQSTTTQRQLRQRHERVEVRSRSQFGYGASMCPYVRFSHVKFTYLFLAFPARSSPPSFCPSSTTTSTTDLLILARTVANRGILASIWHPWQGFHLSEGQLPPSAPYSGPRVFLQRRTHSSGISLRGQRLD
jgi:hypothetical protein